MKDRSDDPLHHEGTLLTQSYISLPGMMQFLIMGMSSSNNCFVDFYAQNGKFD